MVEESEKDRRLSEAICELKKTEFVDGGIG